MNNAYSALKSPRYIALIYPSFISLQSIKVNANVRHNLLTTVYLPVTSCKIFEKVILNRIHTYIDISRVSFSNVQQHSFQKQLHCTTAAYNLQETIYYHAERGSNVYVTYLDQKAAFDSVNHDCLFL